MWNVFDKIFQKNYPKILYEIHSFNFLFEIWKVYEILKNLCMKLIMNKNSK